jgi:hypothetical protein
MLCEVAVVLPGDVVGGVADAEDGVEQQIEFDDVACLRHLYKVWAGG